MTMKRSISHVLAIVGSLLGWFALGAQLVASTELLGSPMSALWRLVGYFTILTNIVVVCVFTRFAFKPESHKGLNSSPFEFITVTAILLVGIVYATLLEGTIELSGLGLIADRIFHYIVPILFTIYWVIKPHGKLSRRHVFSSTIFPIVYAVYALIRGVFTGWYPYFFIDGNVLTAGQIALNVVGLCVAFIIMAIFLLGLDRFLAKRNS